MIEVSSQSQQSVQQQKILDENKEHTQEVLLKAKEVLPDYSEESLLQIYKRYFQVDQVFFNEINIIAKRRLEVQEGDWVTIKTREKAPRHNLKKYNFLHDEKLIWRANNWDKEQAKNRNTQGRNRGNKDREQNKNIRFKQRQQKQQEGKREEQKRTRFEEKRTNRRVQNNNEVKQKYVGKEQENNGKQNEKFKQKTYQGKDNKGNKSRRADGNEKRNNKYREKQEPRAKFQEKKETEPEKVEQKNDSKLDTSSAPVIQNQVPIQPQQAQPKVQQKLKSMPINPSTVKVQEVKKQAQIKQNKQQEIQPKVQIPSKPQPVPTTIVQQSRRQTIKQLPSESANLKKEAQQHQIVKEQKPIVLDKQTINKNFIQSTKKYTKILKFIKPGEKIQKISYVWNNGSIDSVKVHVPLY